MIVVVEHHPPDVVGEDARDDGRARGPVLHATALVRVVLAEQAFADQGGGAFEVEHAAAGTLLDVALATNEQPVIVGFAS